MRCLAPALPLGYLAVCSMAALKGVAKTRGQPDYLFLQKTVLCLDVIKYFLYRQHQNFNRLWVSVNSLGSIFTFSIHILNLFYFKKNVMNYRFNICSVLVCLFSSLGIPIIEMLDFLCLSSISFSPHPFLIFCYCIRFNLYDSNHSLNCDYFILFCII